MIPPMIIQSGHWLAHHTAPAERFDREGPPLLRRPSCKVFAFSMQAVQPIVVDPISPGGVNSPHGLILFDGVCVLCSRACRFVSKHDRSGYFRFVPIQLAEGRPLAEQLGIDPQRPDSFAFVAKGQAYIKSEAALRIARELPGWQWTWVSPPHPTGDPGRGL